MMIFFGKKARLEGRASPKGFLLSCYRRLFGVEDPHSQIRWRSIWPMLEVAGHTLDVGCGNGVFTFDLVEKVKGKVTGIELSEENLEFANSLKGRFLNKCRLSCVHFQKGDIMRLEELRMGFDQALCIDVIEHIEDDLAALRQLSRALKPGGSLIISTITKDYPKFFGYEFHERIGHVRQGYTILELEGLLRASGFEIMEAKHHSKLISQILGVIYYKKEYFKRHPLICLPLYPFVALLGLLDPYIPTKNPLGIAIKAKKAEGLEAKKEGSRNS